MAGCSPPYHEVRMAPSSVGRGALAAHSPPLAAVSTSFTCSRLARPPTHRAPPKIALSQPPKAPHASAASAAALSTTIFSPLLLLLRPHLHLHHLGLHLRRLHPALTATASSVPSHRFRRTAVDPPAMPKVSKYIENKSNVLFDMHRQLADIKRGKAYREGDTATVRRRPGARGEGGRKTRSARSRTRPPAAHRCPTPSPAVLGSK